MSMASWFITVSLAKSLYISHAVSYFYEKYFEIWADWAVRAILNNYVILLNYSYFLRVFFNITVCYFIQSTYLKNSHWIEGCTNKDNSPHNLYRMTLISRELGLNLCLTKDVHSDCSFFFPFFSKRNIKYGNSFLQKWTLRWQSFARFKNIIKVTVANLINPIPIAN